MRVFITGIKGQLGRALQVRLPQATGADLPEVDICDAASIAAAILAARPQVVIHCAAYTDVDGCARDPALAYRVNGLGSQNVALAAQQAGAALMQISTNEVFDGVAGEPYFEFAATHPINPYGRSKQAGEWFATHLCARFYVVRTSWLFAPAAILQLIQTGQYGIYHLTNAGYCSRFEFAREVLRLTGRHDVPLEPITLAEYPRPSTPPPFAPLANNAAATLGITLRPWQQALADYLTHHASRDT
ncbi:MAG: NAD(P)-dependent oxidoreductase [Chloroflexi bacterium]|nr:NAD(P)-dependent oxidoreductase [Chloroflexota bacterium]